MNKIKNLTYNKICANIIIAIAKQVKNNDQKMSLNIFPSLFYFAIYSIVLLCNKSIKALALQTSLS